MASVSVLIPSKNEQFLAQTIDDVCAKSGPDIEVITILDGWTKNDGWPERISSDKRVHYIYFPESRGMRAGLNAACSIARGEFVMKLDAHCMLSPGCIEELARVCREDWVCVPTRKRLDAENWSIQKDNRPDINYLRLDSRNDGVNFMLWEERNRDRGLDKVLIADILSCQGSCYFMHKDYWQALELLDEEHYGSFRKDPQEVSFKAWLSGGKMVRVKSCWYAHLHKGKRYGRGYSARALDKDGRGSDWAKGDEFVKTWFVDSKLAWPKATKPMSWLLEKFSDMPGWEDRKPVEKSVRKLPNTYQVLKVNGEHFTRPKPDRENSRFWNEGKWNTFVAPLLPESVGDHTFVEMGTDCGLYLKMAKDRGYRHALGVEKNKTPVRVGLEWRDTIGGDWRLLQRKLGGAFGEPGNFDIDELPLADVTLMSTFHYYIDINAWIKYVDRLATKTCSVVIISRPELNNGHWLAQADWEAVRGYFVGWEINCYIEPESLENDTKPRALYSVRLDSPLIQRVPIASIDAREDETDPMHAAMMDLAWIVASREEFDPMTTRYAEAWRNRKKGKWSDNTLRRFLNLKVGVLQSIRDEGQKDPLIIDADRRLSDGGHRLVMLKELGYKSAIVRKV